ncbi:DNA-processing protein DprA [Nocardia sp. NPDC004750]
MTNPHAPTDSVTDSSLTWDDGERAALVSLMRLKPKNGDWSCLTEEVIQHGGARALWDAIHPRDLFGESDNPDFLEAARSDIEVWKRGPFEFHTFRDNSYPPQLRTVRQMPPVVFTHGLLLDHDDGVCVVGSRRSSDGGVRFAEEVARSLVARDISVVAGLAEGIDTAAHRAALDSGGRTVAVLGNGLNHVYPRSNRELQREISERGMLLTHFLPEYSPTRYSFLARNVIMSAYGVATVIVEAGEHSGTRTQAREAVAHGRPVILNATVAESTEWARQLRGKPGVYVADSPYEVAQHIDTILGHRALVRNWLHNDR